MREQLKPHPAVRSKIAVRPQFFQMTTGGGNDMTTFTAIRRNYTQGVLYLGVMLNGKLQIGVKETMLNGGLIDGTPPDRTIP